METYLAYFDETGDDGLIKYSSDHFVLTSLYMPSSKWQENYDALRLMRRGLRDDFGLHVTEEFHTKQFLTDKNPYRAFNPVPSMFGFDYRNQPIKNMVEDILEKDSKESYFIQSADFISYFSHLYFLTHDKNLSLPNRVANLIDRSFVDSVLATLKKGEKINLKASRSSHPYGFVIYPK